MAGRPFLRRWSMDGQGVDRRCSGRDAVRVPDYQGIPAVIAIEPPVHPPRTCDTCVHSEHGAVALLCLYGSMARKAADNRALRGLCGPSGHLWKPAENQPQ